jgi:hypothetical protein
MFGSFLTSITRKEQIILGACGATIMLSHAKSFNKKWPHKRLRNYLALRRLLLTRET